MRLALVRISVGESRRYRFSPIGKLDQCKTLCGKIEKGRMATMRSTREIDHLLSHVDEILFPDGKPSRAGTITPAIWAPIRKAINGSWLDAYNNNTVMGIPWVTGHPTPIKIQRSATHYTKKLDLTPPY